MQTVLDSTRKNGRTVSTVSAVSVGLSVGFRDSSRDGVASRVSVGAGTGGGYAGIYFEMPRSWMSDWDVGGGTMAYLGEMKAINPYVQLGYQASETVAPFVSIGSYFVSRTPGDRVRPAVTLGASIDKFEGRQSPGTGIFWFSVLFGSTRVTSADCFILCIPERGYFPGTMFLVGLSSNLMVRWPTNQPVTRHP